MDTSGLLCLWVTFSSAVPHSAALRSCYNCVYNENPEGANFECVTAPENYAGGPHTELCSVTQTCYTTRTVTVAMGTVYTLSRGCDYTSRTAGCSTEPTGAYETCVQVCDDADLCNGDDYNSTPVLQVKAGPGASPAPRPWRTFKEDEMIECYLCQYSYNPHGDASCVTDPAKLGTIKCPPTRTCYVQSQYDKANKVIRSFSRGCDDMSHMENECRDETYFNDCLMTCCSDRCNHGDGEPKNSHKCAREEKPAGKGFNTASGGGGKSEKPARKNFERVLRNWRARQQNSGGVAVGSRGQAGVSAGVAVISWLLLM